MSNGHRIIQGLNDAIAHARGEKNCAREHVVIVRDNIDVRAIRQKLGLSQKAFALRFNFDLATFRQWERKRCFPTGPARTLLILINRDPETVQRLLACTPVRAPIAHILATSGHQLTEIR